MAGEILEQLLIANRFERIRNIVFMSVAAVQCSNTRGLR
jgi:hypothetical protein